MCPKTDVDEQTGYIHTKAYYLVIKRKKNLQIQITIWMTLRNLMLSKRCQTQAYTLYDSIHMKYRNRHSSPVVITITK